MVCTGRSEAVVIKACVCWRTDLHVMDLSGRAVRLMSWPAARGPEVGARERRLKCIHHPSGPAAEPEAASKSEDNPPQSGLMTEIGKKKRKRKKRWLEQKGSRAACVPAAAAAAAEVDCGSFIRLLLQLNITPQPL